jgi:Smg protein
MSKQKAPISATQQLVSFCDVIMTRRLMTGNPLKERVLAIVSIIAQYVMDERELPSECDIVEELLASGFEAEEIDAAFHWMEGLAMHRADRPVDPMTILSQRIFTTEECHALSREARGFLMQLRQLGILDDDIQEEIIQKALHMAEDELTLKEAKVLTALSFFARSHNEWLREVDCFMEDDWTRMYH